MPDKEEGSCSCHITPPCDWCTSLDEYEADAFANGGREALEELWSKREEYEAHERNRS